METMPHILVVDDDRDIRELLARFLERNRFRVTAARDGREARRAWPLGHYQLVVLDLMLPGESGLDLARWLRGTSDVPIVMLTAMGEETDRIIGLELGATITCPSPSIRANCWRAYAPSSAAPRSAPSASRSRQPRPSDSTAGCWNPPAAACSTRTAPRSH
jgi:two-component system OmpR family response regulator